MTGQSQIYNHDEIKSAMKEILFHKQTTYHILASALNLPKSTVCNINRDPQQAGQIIKAHKNAACPKLTEECKTSLVVLHCINHLQLNHPEQLHPSPEVTFEPGKVGFNDRFYDQLHVDEMVLCSVG